METYIYISAIIGIAILIFVLYSLQEIVNHTKATRKNTSQMVDLLEIIAKKMVDKN